MSEGNVVEITILVDNVAEPALRAEHGFAVWIQVAGRRLLFDTGQGGALKDNADILGVDLGAVDALVLSHGHYDHTGGVPHVLSFAPAAAVYAHPATIQSRYSIRAGQARPIGMPEPSRTALDSHPAGVRWTTRPAQLADGVGLTGPIARLTDYEDAGGPFFLDAAGSEPDPIADDQALWMRTRRGLVVVVGCGHAGVVNTLHQALRSSGERHLHAVLGGLHLGEASEQRLAQTMEGLKQLDPDLVVPCHCTGDAAVQRLRRTFGERVVPGSAGRHFRLGAA